MPEQREVCRLASKLLEENIIPQSTRRETDAARDAEGAEIEGDLIFCLRTSGAGVLRLTERCCQQQQRSQILEEYLGILETKVGSFSTNQPSCLTSSPGPLASLSPALHSTPSWREARSEGRGPAGVQNTKPGRASDLGWNLETSGVLFLSQQSMI